MRFSLKPLHLLQHQRLMIGLGYCCLFLIGAYLIQTARLHKSEAVMKPASVQVVENGFMNLSSYSFFGKSPEPLTEIQKANWKLKGIIFNANREGVAILEINQQEKTLKEGDAIDSSTRIDQIDKEKIIVIQDGKKHTQRLFKASEESVNASAYKPAQAEQNVRTPGMFQNGFRGFKRGFQN